MLKETSKTLIFPIPEEKKRKNLEHNRKIIKEIIENKIKSKKLKAILINREFREVEDPVTGEKEVHYSITINDLGNRSTFVIPSLKSRKINKEEAKAILREIEKTVEEYRTEIEKLEKIKKGELPVIEIIQHGDTVYSCTLPELVQGKEVPEEVVGLIIGTCGINIRKLSLLAGRKIHINRGKPLFPKIIDRMKVYYNLNIPAFSEEKLKEILHTQFPEKE